MPDFMWGAIGGAVFTFGLHGFFHYLGPWLLGWRNIQYNVRWSDTHKRLVIERQVKWQQPPMTAEQTPEEGMRAWSMRRIDGGFILIAPDGEVAFDEPVSEDFAAFIANGQNGWLQLRADIKAVRKSRDDAAADLAAARVALERIAGGSHHSNPTRNMAEKETIARDTLAALDRKKGA